MKKLLFFAAFVVAGLASSTSAKAETTPLVSEPSSNVITTTKKMSVEAEKTYRCFYWCTYWYKGVLYHKFLCF
ncbi:hypothetical protein [Apibacter adventoris]|uniref:Uncharacterized protein n=1 Tax=Apibacter adventoris TaxID=1679466 RepID=A0A2S8AGV6_9FLAO|nr:hypothetical protein [Apibacter adventoris]PQL95472.1 hypothetical protein C4S77_01370 [Apibacter adventoris]